MNEGSLENKFILGHFAEWEADLAEITKTLKPFEYAVLKAIQSQEFQKEHPEGLPDCLVSMLELFQKYRGLMAAENPYVPALVEVKKALAEASNAMDRVRFVSYDRKESKAPLLVEMSDVQDRMRELYAKLGSAEK